MIKILFILASIFAISNADDIDLDATSGEAQRSHKHVLIFFHKPNCSYCETMSLFTLQDEEVEQLIKTDFIFVDIDISTPGEVTFKDFRGSKREFAIFLGYDFYPTTVFIDEDSEIVYKQPGYKDEDKFLTILRFVQSHSYEDMGIEDFK